MKTTVMSVIFFVALPAFASGPIPGEVSCDKGADIAKVQALVKRTAAALKKDPNKVIQEINHRDKQWQEGDLYMVVLQGTTVLAHGYLPSLVGQDFGSTKYQNTYTWIRSGQRMAMERGEGCIQYKFHDPSKGGQVEDKVSYALKVNDTTWAVSGTYLLK